MNLFLCKHFFCLHVTGMLFLQVLCVNLFYLNFVWISHQTWITCQNLLIGIQFHLVRFNASKISCWFRLISVIGLRLLVGPLIKHKLVALLSIIFIIVVNQIRSKSYHLPVMVYNVSHALLCILLPFFFFYFSKL